MLGKKQKAQNLFSFLCTNQIHYYFFIIIIIIFFWKYSFDYIVKIAP